MARQYGATVVGHLLPHTVDKKSDVRCQCGGRELRGSPRKARPQAKCPGEKGWRTLTNTASFLHVLPTLLGTAVITDNIRGTEILVCAKEMLNIISDMCVASVLSFL